MIGRASVLARAFVAVLIVFAYTALAHRFSTTQNVGVTLLPLAMAPLVIALVLRRRKWMAVLCVALIAGIWWLPDRLELVMHNLAWLYFAQDSALNITLCFLFGRTLLPGRLPLCSRIAIGLHANPTSHLLRYTHRATLAWTLFFATMVVVSAGLFFGADRVTWSSFANLLYWPLLLLMFASEYLARLILLPRAERAGFWATINAFRNPAVFNFDGAEARS
jgi:uncharacterized membrane protein